MRGGGVADSAALFADRQPQPDEQMGLAGAGATEQHDWLAGVQVVPGGKMAQGGGRDTGDGVDVELRQPFQPRELGVVDAPAAAPFGAVVAFGGQDFGEVTQVGVAFPVGYLGQAAPFGAHGGQMQLACRGADRGLCGGIDGPGLCGV